MTILIQSEKIILFIINFIFFYKNLSTDKKEVKIDEDPNSLYIKQLKGRIKQLEKKNIDLEEKMKAILVKNYFNKKSKIDKLIK